MTAFRIYNPFPVYLDSQGNLAVSGYLQFFDSGTTTPKDVYGDSGLTVNNGNQIAIGTDGRTVNGLGMPIDIWGNGNYRVRLYASDNTLVAERDDVELPGGGGTAIPALQAGKFLTSDGAVLLWADVIQVPDPTGMSGKVLGTDGTNLFWQNNVAPPAAANIAVTAGSLRIADTTTTTTSGFVQAASGSIPPSGAHIATGSVTFAVPYKTGTSPIVVATGNGSGIAPGGYYGVVSLTNITNTGFTFSVNVNEGGSQSPNNITSTVYFSYIAFGIIDTP